MATDPGSPTARKPEPDLSRGDLCVPVGAALLAWAVPLAAIVPWRAFPVIRRTSTGPLVAAYLASVAGSLALTLNSLSKAGWPTGMWHGVLLDQALSLMSSLLTLYVLLTLSGASRRQRVGETLAVGLKFSLAARASVFLCTAAIYLSIRIPGLAPGGAGWTAYVISWMGLEAYMIAGMSLAAARLADREDRVQTHDPLWPRCIQCDYSLRGLPTAEAWLAWREGQASMPSLDGGSSACPECGMAIADSLRSWEAWLARGQEQPGTGASLNGPGSQGTDNRMRGFERLVRWMVDGRRTTAVALWLVSAAVLGVAITAIPWILRRSPWSAIAYMSLDTWQKTLLWSGAAGLLAGLRFSLRSRHNVFWLSQHVLAPAILVGGTMLVVLLVRYRDSGGIVTSTVLGLHAIFLPLVPIVLIAEWIILRRVRRMWSARAWR